MLGNPATKKSSAATTSRTRGGSDPKAPPTARTAKTGTLSTPSQNGTATKKRGSHADVAKVAEKVDQPTAAEETAKPKRNSLIKPPTAGRRPSKVSVDVNKGDVEKATEVKQTAGATAGQPAEESAKPKRGSLLKPRRSSVDVKKEENEKAEAKKQEEDKRKAGAKKKQEGEEQKKTDEAEAKKIEEENKRKEVEAKKEEAEVKKKEDDETRKKEEEQEKQAEVKKKEEQEAKKKEEETKKKEADAKKTEEEETRKREEQIKQAEAKKKEEAEATKKEEAEAKKREEEQKKKEAGAKKKQEAEAKTKEEEEKQKEAEAKKKVEAEAKKKGEEKQKEVEAKKTEEAEAKKKEAAEVKRKEEEQKKQEQEEVAKRKKAEVEAEAKEKEAQTKKKNEEEAKKKKEEEEAARKAAEETKKKEEEKKKAEAEAKQKEEEQAKKNKEEKEAKQKEEAESKKVGGDIRNKLSANMAMGGPFGAPPAKKKEAAPVENPSETPPPETSADDTFGGIAHVKRAAMGGARKKRNKMAFDAAPDGGLDDASPGSLAASITVKASSEVSYAVADTTPAPASAAAHKSAPAMAVNPMMAEAMNRKLKSTAERKESTNEVAPIKASTVSPKPKLSLKAKKSTNQSRKGPFEVKIEPGQIDHVFDKLSEIDSDEGANWAMLVTDGHSNFSVSAYGNEFGQEALDKVKKLVDTTMLSYLVFNTRDEHITSVVGSSNTVVLVVWQGDKVRLLEKAKSGPLRVDFSKFCMRFFTIGAEVMTGDVAQLNMDYLGSFLKGSKGKVGAGSQPSPSHRRTESSGSTTSVHKRGASNSNDSGVSSSSSPKIKEAGEAPDGLVKVRKYSSKEPTSQTQEPQGGRSFEGKDEIKQACTDLMDDKKDLDFLVLSFQGKGFDQIKVAGVGKGCLTDEWRTKWCDDTALYAIVLKVASSEGGCGLQEKVAYVQWVGPKVKVLSKGMAAEMYPFVMNFVRPLIRFTGNTDIRSSEEMTRENIMNHISGSRVRGKEKLVKKSMKLGKDIKLKYKDKDQVMTTLRALAKDPFGGLTSEELKTRAETIDLTAAAARKGSNNWFDSQLSWAVLAFDREDPTMLVQIASGTGTALSSDFGSKSPSKAEAQEQEELDALPTEPSRHWTKHLKSDNIVFITHRIMRVPEQYRYSANKGKYLQPKYGLVLWLGEEIDVLQKAMSSHHWAEFTEMTKSVMTENGVYLQPGYLCASKLGEITAVQVRDAMKLEDPNI